jgi:hypothetical protein
MAESAAGNTSELEEPLLSGDASDAEEGQPGTNITALYKEAMLAKMGCPLAKYTFKLGPYEVPLPYGGALLAFFAYSALLYNFINQLFSVYSKVRNTPTPLPALL